MIFFMLGEHMPPAVEPVFLGWPLGTDKCAALLVCRDRHTTLADLYSRNVTKVRFTPPPPPLFKLSQLLRHQEHAGMPLQLSQTEIVVRCGISTRWGVRNTSFPIFAAGAARRNILATSRRDSRHCGQQKGITPPHASAEEVSRIE